MRTRRGFTLIEALLVAFLLFLLVFIMEAHPDYPRESANRVVCAADLSGIYKAMYTYSVTSDGSFPVAGRRTSGGPATGFREGDRRTGLGAALDDNLTACLWMVVRDGSASPKFFFCPSTTDRPDPMVDALGQPADLLKTHDFATRENLSFSTIDPFRGIAGGNTRETRWSNQAPVDWVLMGDNNANNGAMLYRHSLPPIAGPQFMAEYENSPNHAYTGQNFVFGDGHVAWCEAPFVGPHRDNVYAVTRNGRNAAPTVAHDDGDAASDRTAAAHDVTLVPLSGNGGNWGSLSGNTLDVVGGTVGGDTSRLMDLIFPAALALPIPLLLWLLLPPRGKSDRAESQHGYPNGGPTP